MEDVNLKIGEKIKSKRIEKGWKQEELAISVGVSTQAVSKWETENSYPDIVLLPKIARSLDITIDELMSFDLELPKAELDSIVEKAVDKYVEKGFEVGHNYVKEILNKYPNSISLKFYLGNLFQTAMLEKDLLQKENIQKRYLESSKLYEEVLESGIPEFDYKTRVILVGHYTMLGEYEKAEKMIESLPDFSMDKNIMFGSLYTLTGEKEKAKETQKKNLKNSAIRLIQTLNLLAILELEENWDRALELSNKSVEISRILGQYEFNSLQNHIKILMENEKLEEASLAFEKLANSIESLDKEIKPEERHEYVKSLLAKSILMDKDFDKIRDYDVVKLSELKLRNWAEN